MALTGIDIFKVTPKKNCKECGAPTCMAFAMKVAQGAMTLESCPHLDDSVIAKLSDATAPPMKTIKIGAGANEVSLGGETVLARHEKTFVSKNIFAVTVCDNVDDAALEAKLAGIVKVDYERISERMIVETVFIAHCADTSADRAAEVIAKADATGRIIAFDCEDADVAKTAMAQLKGKKPILLGATMANFEAMNAVAKEIGAVLGIRGADLDELHDLAEKLEKLENKELIIDLGVSSIKDAFRNGVEIRRAAVKGEDRTFGYPSIVNLAKLAPNDLNMQTALASIYTLKYGSVIVMDEMTYAEALPLYGLRQNIFTDPQKPMKVEPTIYPLNGADENSPCLLTVDFALTYFVVSGEIERSGVPTNLLIPDAGGYSVLTAWAAGKFGASSIAKFIKEADIESKVKTRKLVIPGLVAVLKGELEDKLPEWEIIVGPNEAMQLVKFLKDFK